MKQDPGDRLTSFTWNSLKHLQISVKCEPSPWPCQCQGTLVPWAKIANLNGFQLSHGWMPAPPACRLPWHFKGLLAGSVTHAEGKAGLWTRGPARLTCTTPRRKQQLPYGCLAGQRAGAQITCITQEAGKQPRISLSRVRISATQAARGVPQAAWSFSSANLGSFGDFCILTYYEVGILWTFGLHREMICIWYSLHINRCVCF